MILCQNLIFILILQILIFYVNLQLINFSHILMSLRLDIKKKLVVHSPRVKSVQFHPELTWILTGLYSGAVAIHDYQTQSCIKTLQVCQLPVRSAKFIAKKQWIVTGTDDMYIRVFNYNTMERVKAFQAHSDFLRSIVVHPQQNIIISCSDDGTIKMWDYEKGFGLIRTLVQHKHFVLQIAINPRDLSKFASASMDKTIKIWSMTSQAKANFTLTGHIGGVNCIDFYKGDKPYIVSGSDDRAIKIWDYQTKQCVVTLQGHLLPVTSVLFHPSLPILISCGQNGKVLIHHSNSFNLENTLQYNLDRAWSIDVSKENSSIICFGFDQGTVAIKIGPQDPIVSMSTGKLLWTKSMDVISANLKALNIEEITNQQRINVQSKELGTCDMFPTYIKHSPNGHLFAITNDKQFSVMRTATFKNAKFGQGTDLVWNNQNDFAVRDNNLVKIYKNNQMAFEFKPQSLSVGLSGGVVLGVVSATNVVFYSWETYKIIGTINHSPKKLIWNDQGTIVALIYPQKFIVYEFDHKKIQFSQGYTIVDKITSGIFIYNCFFYITLSGKLHYSIKGKSFFFVNSDKRRYIVGTIQQHNRLYTFDKNNNVYSHEISFPLINLISDIAYGKVININPQQILPQYRDRLAKFLDAFDLRQQAFSIVENQEHKFELAINLHLIREAFKIAQNGKSPQKYKIVGDIALSSNEIELAITCYEKINDLNGLLLIYSTLSLPKQLNQLASKAEKLTRMNVAFQCYFLTNQPSKCLDILIKSKKFPEAALFARTYFPQRISQCVNLWKSSIDNKTISNKISDPTAEQQVEQQQEGGNDDEQA